ncbi:MAG: carbon-nitrogen hydrolase family protein [Bacteroidota bacterium]
MKNESRRNFIRKSALGVGAVTIAANSTLSGSDDSDKKESKHLPREVWIATISQHEIFTDTTDEMVAEMLKLMEEIAPLNPDIIVLPEVFPYSNIPKRPPLAESAENKIGPIIKPFANFAKKNNCYVICSTYTEDKGKYYNSAVLLDRQGEYVGEYHKMFPTEGEMKRGISPGESEPPVFETDFGKIGMQICFDNEWIEGWHKLHKAGAEVVFWPSAFSGGTKLNSFAKLFNYHLVSSSRKDEAKIIDITGEDVASTGRWEPNWICAPINLEKVVIPTWPYYVNFKEMEAKYGRNIKITSLHDEEISIVESLSADLKVVDVLKDYNIKTRKEYLLNAEKMQNKLRK